MAFHKIWNLIHEIGLLHGSHGEILCREKQTRRMCQFRYGGECQAVEEALGDEGCKENEDKPMAVRSRLPPDRSPTGLTSYPDFN